MDLKEKINQLLNDAFETHKHLFLIDLTINESNKINIVLDGDKGVNLQDCIGINKLIDAYLESAELDNAVEVASYGATSPLKIVRQYIKNIGRNLKVKTMSQGEIEAELITANETEISLSWTAREPKEIGKGKVTVQKNITIPYSDIKESIVIISF